jgi:cobalt/nickel transport system permease protein
VSKGNGEILTSLFNISIYKTGVNEMTSILIKITLCVTLAIILTATTSNIEIIYGLQKLKVSPLLVSIFSFAIRYIDVFIDEVKRVRVSMRSRGYSEKGFRTLKPLAFASGALLIRGYERGERVYNSMISRGFKGTLELKEREFKSSKLILLVSIFSIAVSTLDWFIT